MGVFSHVPSSKASTNGPAWDSSNVCFLIICIYQKIKEGKQEEKVIGAETKGVSVNLRKRYFLFPMKEKLSKLSLQNKVINGRYGFFMLTICIKDCKTY